MRTRTSPRKSNNIYRKLTTGDRELAVEPQNIDTYLINIETHSFCLFKYYITKKFSSMEHLQFEDSKWKYFQQAINISALAQY